MIFFFLFCSMKLYKGNQRQQVYTDKMNVTINKTKKHFVFALLIFLNKEIKYNIYFFPFFFLLDAIQLGVVQNLLLFSLNEASWMGSWNFLLIGQI